MTQETTPRRTFSPEREALARALCLLRGEDPERRVVGITGREWTAWEQTAIHSAPLVEQHLRAAGFNITRVAT